MDSRAFAAIGLHDWTSRSSDRATNVVPLASSPRRLCWLKATPFWVEQQTWFGVEVLDGHGHCLGRVQDLLIEVRSLDECAAARGGDLRGVRALYAAVRQPAGWRPWRRSRQLLLPVSRLAQHDGALYTDEHASELAPLLFGR